MRPLSFASMLVTAVGGGSLFVLASAAEFVISGVLGFVFFEKVLGAGFGVPFRFFRLGIFGLSSGYFSSARALLDWLVWCLVFVVLSFVIRACWR